MLAVVLQVRDRVLQALLWQRAREPFTGAWALPGGTLAADETLDGSIRRHLAAKVDVREVAHLEQLGTGASPPGTRPAASSPPPFSASSRRRRSGAARGHRWHAVDALPTLASTTARSCSPAASACAASSRTRTSASRSRRQFTLSELRDLYAAALGHDVSATNLQRVLLRRACSSRPAPGATGTRRRTAGEVYRFRTRQLEITDPFAALRRLSRRSATAAAPSRRPGARVGVELGHRLADVRPHRLGRDEEALADLLVRDPVREQAEESRSRWVRLSILSVAAELDSTPARTGST